MDHPPGGGETIGRIGPAKPDENVRIKTDGAVRPEDVLPNNTVLSENVAELRIIKRESGHVRDGYRRGFLTRFLDRFSPI